MRSSTCGSGRTGLARARSSSPAERSVCRDVSAPLPEETSGLRGDARARGTVAAFAARGIPAGLTRPRSSPFLNDAHRRDRGADPPGPDAADASPSRTRPAMPLASVTRGDAGAHLAAVEAGWASTVSASPRGDGGRGRGLVAAAFALFGGAAVRLDLLVPIYALAGLRSARGHHRADHDGARLPGGRALQRRSPSPTTPPMRCSAATPPLTAYLASLTRRWGCLCCRGGDAGGRRRRLRRGPDPALAAAFAFAPIQG